MSAERGVVRKAAQLVAIANGLRQEGIGEAADLPHPIYWPALTAEEAEPEWEELRRWVDQLQVRFPNASRVPDCWWRHNDLVEVLAALRDYERACFAPTASATAAVDWQRALRDMEMRMDIWIKRLTCTVPGRGHVLLDLSDDDEADGWTVFVQQDVDRRRFQSPHRECDDASTENPRHGPHSINGD